MPLRSQNRRRFEVVAGGHPGSCGRVAVLNGRNVALGQTDTFGQKRTHGRFPQFVRPSLRHSSPPRPATQSWRTCFKLNQAFARGFKRKLIPMRLIAFIAAMVSVKSTRSFSPNTAAAAA